MINDKLLGLLLVTGIVNFYVQPGAASLVVMLFIIYIQILDFVHTRRELTKRLEKMNQSVLFFVRKRQ